MPQVKVGWRSGSVSPVVSVSKLLDTYSSSAAAYSLRKLSSTYTGSAIRVRRSSDNTEQNIGFDSDGNLDTVALSAFVGSGSGFVTTWYDQSGNSRNVAQTTAANQPRIVNTGAIELLNGKVCFSNYGQNQWLQLNSFGSNIASIFSFAMVGSVGNDSFRVALKFNPPSTGNNSKLQVNGFASLTSLEMQGSSSIYYSFPGVMNTTIPHIIQGTFNSTTSEFSVNNQTLLTGNAGPSTLNGIIIGADWNGAYPTSGKYQEVVVWGVNKSTDRSGINTALNTYYSVYPNPTSVWNLLAAAYNADTTASSSLKTSLFAAYNGESNTNDSFGTNNGTAVGGLTYTTGKIGNAFQFNGTNAQIDFTANTMNIGDTFSVSYWGYYVNNAANGQCVLSNYYETGGKWGFFIYTSNGIHYLNRFNGTYQYSLQSTVIPINTWKHFVFTRKADSTKIYVDGVLVASDTNTAVTAYNVLCKPRIGSREQTGVWRLASGTNIDALNIWQKELTQSEITELYNSGNGAQYIGDNFYKPTTNDALNTYNGTAQGGLTYDAGKVGTAFKFNGTNSRVDFGNAAFNFGTDSFSISTWFYPNSGNVLQCLVNKGLLTATEKGFSLLIDNRYNSNQRGISFAVGGGSGNYQQFSTTNQYTIGAWNHIICIWDAVAKTIKIYLNGIQATTTITQTGGTGLAGITDITNTVRTGQFGAYGTFTNWFNGRLDATTIWNRELSASEITELYNAGNGKQYPN